MTKKTAGTTPVPAAALSEDSFHFQCEVESVKGRLLELSNMLKVCTLLAVYTAPEPLATMLQHVETELGNQYARLDEAVADFPVDLDWL